MFNNPYMQRGINQQNMYEQIDNQINQLNQMKEQMKNNQQQQTPITQNFQLAPNSHTMRYANTIDDVTKETVYFDTPFFSKDMSVLWIKSVNGNIKTYELNEILPKDEKDMQIEFLQSQIEELKGMIKNDANVANDDAKQNETNTSTNDEPVGATTKKSKSTSIQKVSRSKTK